VIEANYKKEKEKEMPFMIYVMVIVFVALFFWLDGCNTPSHKSYYDSDTEQTPSRF